MMRKAIYTCLLSGAAGILMLAACQKESVNSSGKSPYGDGVQPAITFAEEDPVAPVMGFAGEVVTLRGKGFLAVKDKLTVQFGGINGEITTVTDSTVKVKIPGLGCSGAISAQVGQEFYYGPFFQVLGPFQMDTLFPSQKGANRYLEAVLPLPDGKYMIGGAFTEYDNSAIKGGVNRLARINADGSLDRTFTYGENTGPTGGTITKIIYLPVEKKYLVAGGFAAYDQVANVHSIAKVNQNGGVDNVSVLRPSGNTVAVSSMGGGFRGTIFDMFQRKDGKIIVMGNFKYYVKPNYNLSTVELKTDSMHLDSTLIYHIARLHPDGGLDSSYHYDLVNHEGKLTVNAPISRAALLPDDKLMIAGNFTTYAGAPTPRIARLNQDGTLDPSFNPGSGADQVIEDMAVQPDGKLLVTGRFKRFNGVKAGGLVRLMPDGAVDPTFNVGDGADGYGWSLGLLPGGQIVLSGYFRKFNGVPRNNLVVLAQDGSVHPTFNSNGGFMGGLVNKVVTMTGGKAALLVGAFTQFDFRPANSIVKMKLE